MDLTHLQSSNLHFVGIGGSGMSGLARISLALGIRTSGSDAKDSKILEDLRTLGATIYLGHNASHLLPDSTLVISSAISDDNPEILAAKKMGLICMTRAELLATFMLDKRSIAVAGTHGKTTTTSMLTVALQSLGLDPSFAIGGTINRGGTNAHLGSGEFFIAEADESDGSFIAYKPGGAVITNIELDHVDNFPNIEAVMEIFYEFVKSIRPNGFLVIGNGGPSAQKLLDNFPRKDIQVLTYGKTDADLTYSHLALNPTGARARVAFKGKILGEVEVSIPGEHNLLNALAVIGVGISTNQPVAEFFNGIRSFTGARRRFEVKGKINGVTVVDDYGHHPTEIEVTLQAAKNFIGPGKVLVIFQPHRYTRTQAFTTEFAKSLASADQVFLLEIYSAGESPIPGVSSKIISDQIPGSIYNPSMIEVVEEVTRLAKPGDLIITLGAGDVSALAPIILESLDAN
jgi:UDP-N-acetylmuramate--alanine ligase